MDQNQRRAVTLEDRSIKIHSRGRITQACREKGRLYLSSLKALSIGNHIYDA